MKKMICALLALLMIIALSACDASDNKETASKETDKENAATTETASSPSKAIDVDLTKLSSTMVYSEVYNMMTKPSDYMEKIVKMNGNFSIYHDETTDKYYFACVIADATACCSQGLEFVLAGDYKYPEDYPALGTEITVVGEFSTYNEGNNQYCNLINASLQ